MVIESLFPSGIAHYLAGGLLIGTGVAAIYAASGIAPGASTFLESTLSYASGASRFQQHRFVSSRDWRVVFALGMVLGGTAYALTVGDLGWTTGVQPWRLLLGGTLVGVGTRLGKGCTSGHGICGMGSLSSVSIANVATFVAVAVGTALLVQSLGVSP